jgi:hypothetical protein
MVMRASATPSLAAEHDGPLAEFTALRQEIDSRAAHQHGVLALHITSAGAIFGYALSAPSRLPVLLILPISTYLFAAQYVMYLVGSVRIAEYIETSLSERVPGGLLWESWQRHQPPLLRTANRAHPLYVAFPGIALAALAWTAPTVWADASLLANRIGLMAAWAVGLAAAAFSFILVRGTTRGIAQSRKGLQDGLPRLPSE